MTVQVTAGLELLMLGMGIVFLFLALLVIVVVIMSKLVLRYLPEAPEGTPVKVIVNNEHNVTAAISAAVHQYRVKHQSKE